MIPARVGVAPTASRRCSTPSRRSSSRRRPGHASVVAARRARAPRRRLPLPGRRAPGALRHLVRDRAGPDHRDRRQHRRGQDDARQPRACGCSTPPRARCSSTASTCATSSPSCCGARSASCRRSRTCSRARSRATCATASPTPPTTSCGRRSRSRRPRDFVRRCPAGSTRRSRRAAPTCRAASASGSSIARALVRKPDIYVFDDSFSALDLATDARLRAALAPVHRRRRGRHRGAAGLDDHRPPTRSSCSRTARIVGLGTHDELLETCPTYAEIVAVADRPRRTRHERHRRRSPSDDADDDERAVDAAATELAPVGGGRWNAAGMPARAVEGLQALDCAASRPRCCGPSGSASSSVLVARGRQRRRCSCSAPKVLGHATNIIVRRRARAAAASTSPRCTTRCSLALGALRRRRRCCRSLQAYLLAGVVQRTMFRLRADVEDKLNRAAAQLRRPAAARRPAQPGHQRHRQPRAEPAADAEPDAHLGADCSSASRS